MFEFFLNFAKGNGSIGPSLDYICDRMDTVLKAMIGSKPYETLLSLFSMLGIFMLLVYFLVDLLDKVSDTQFSLEILFRQLLKFIILYTIMSHLSALLNGFLDFTVAINDLIITKVNEKGPGSFWKELTDKANYIFGSTDMLVEDAGGLTSLISVIGTQVVMQFLTWKMSIERALRIGYKSLMAPIACADMVTNGMSSNGIRYLKSIFALYMQSPILLLIMVCMNEVCNKVTHINGAKQGGFWSVVIGLFILSNTVKRSKEIAEEII